MNFFEKFGLTMLTSAAIIFPFGYWLHRSWYLAAALLACIGAFLFFSKRVSQRFAKSRQPDDHLEVPYVPSHLRGFPGAKVTRERDTDFDGEADGE